MNILLMISLALFLTSFTIFFYAVLTKFLLPSTVLAEQLNFYRHSWERYYGRSLTRHEIGAGARLIGAIFRITEYLTKRTNIAVVLKKKLDSSGVAITFVNFVLYQFITMLALGFLAYFLSGFLAALIVVGMTAAAPFIYLNIIASRRQAKLGEQLPELLTMVSGLLKVGHGIYQAIDSAVREMSPPLSFEFKRVLTESRLGISFEQALEGMAKRVRNPDFEWMVIAVRIQRETGGNLSEILDMLARTIREREQLAGQVKALTAEGRLSAYILIGLPFAIALLLGVINPAYVGLLFTTTIGLIMLSIAGVLMLIGIYWLRKIITIRV